MTIAAISPGIDSAPAVDLVSAIGMSSAADVVAELSSDLGLADVDIRYGLTQEELFAAAIEGDLGRVRPGGPDGEHKARRPADLLHRPVLHGTPGAGHLLCGPALDE